MSIVTYSFCTRYTRYTHNRKNGILKIFYVVKLEVVIALICDLHYKSNEMDEQIDQVELENLEEADAGENPNIEMLKTENQDVAVGGNTSTKLS